MTSANEPIANPNYRGLTKREYFAALAMQGLLSVYDNNNHLVPNMPNVKYMAELSVTASDELIKQLNKTEPNA